MQILTTHVGTTAMSHATALAFGRFSKYAPQVIMNLIEDNLFRCGILHLIIVN